MLRGLCICLGMDKSNFGEQFPKGAKLKAKGLFRYVWPFVTTINWRFKLVATILKSTHFELFIKDFDKIISYIFRSKNSIFQGAPLNGRFRNNSSTRVVKIWKRLQNVSGDAFRKSYYKILRKVPARNAKTHNSHNIWVVKTSFTFLCNILHFVT